MKQELRQFPASPETPRKNSCDSVGLISVLPSACVCGFLLEDLLGLRFTNTSPGRHQSPTDRHTANNPTEAEEAERPVCTSLYPSVQVSPIPELLAYTWRELPSEGLCLA